MGCPETLGRRTREFDLRLGLLGGEEYEVLLFEEGDLLFEEGNRLGFVLLDL